MAERRIRITVDPEGAVRGSGRAKRAIREVGEESNRTKGRLSDLERSSRAFLFGAADAVRPLETQSARARQELARSERQARRTADAVGDIRLPRALRRSIASLRSGLTSVARQAALTATGLFTIYAAVQGVRQIIDYADAWRSTGNLLTLVTENTEHLIATQRELGELAAETYARYEPTVNLYARLARSAQDLELSQARILGVTRTVNEAIAISGTTGEEARNGIIQFAQGLASGALRGDELRSVLEQMPRLARALADGLGVGIGELRTLGAEGELTTERVISALERAAPEIRDEFAQLPATIREAFGVLTDSVGSLIGQLDQAQGFSASAANSLLDLAASVRAYANTIGEAGGGTQSYISDLESLRENAEQAAAAQERLTRLEAERNRNSGGRRRRGLSAEIAEAREEFERLASVNPELHLQILNDRLQDTRDRIDSLSARQRRRPIFAQLSEQARRYEAAIKRAQDALDSLTESADDSSGDTVRDDAAVERITRTYQRQADAIGRTRDELALYQLAQAGATEAERSAVAALQARIQAAREEESLAQAGQDRFNQIAAQTQANNDFVESLRARTEAFSQSALQQQIAANLARLNAEATAEQRQAVVDETIALYERAQAQAALNGFIRETERDRTASERDSERQAQADERLIDAARRRVQSLRAVTDQQRLAIALSGLSASASEEERAEYEALIRVELELAEAKREREESERELQRSQREAEREARRFAETLSSDLNSALEEGILSGRGFGSALVDLGEDMARLILRITVLQPLAQSLIETFNAPGGGGGGLGGFFRNLLGGLAGGAAAQSAPTAYAPAAATSGRRYLSNLGGFQTGGSFIVGGSGPPDSRNIAFRATPGERVTVETPEQQRQDRLSVVVNNYNARENEVRLERTIGPSGETLLYVNFLKMARRAAKTGDLAGILGTSPALVQR